MNILILSKLENATGNKTTASRIASMLEEKHNVILIDTQITSEIEIEKTISKKNIDAALGIHALHAGALLQNLDIPYTLILSGTDIYHQFSAHQNKTMSLAIQNAKSVIAFCKENLDSALKKWPAIKEKSLFIHQSVDISSINREFNIRDHLKINRNKKIAIIPAGIRKVKDPFYIIEEFAKLHTKAPNIELCIVGPVIEADFAKDRLSRIKELNGIHYISELDYPKILASIEQSDVLVNSSISEGMSAAILEAMALNTPIIARHNDGNLSLIEHDHNGFVYKTPNEAISQIMRIIESKEISTRFNLNNIKILKKHTLNKEKQLYEMEIQAITTIENK